MRRWLRLGIGLVITASIAAGVLLHRSRDQASTIYDAAAPPEAIRSLSYYWKPLLRDEELLVGTLSSDGDLVPNPDLLGDGSAVVMSRTLAGKLDATGQPLRGLRREDAAKLFDVEWNVERDGTVTMTFDGKSTLAKRVRVDPEGTLSDPDHRMRYDLREDGVVLRQSIDGVENFGDRWRIQGNVGAHKRRAMIGLVMLGFDG